MYARRAVPVEENTLASGRGGWWGIAFAVGLLVVGAMADLPTAALSGERIAAFYAAHRQVIVAQQVVGALLVAPLLGFAAALDRRIGAGGGRGPRLVVLAGLLLGAANLATIVPPLVLALLTAPSPATAHTLTLVADLADAALFATSAAFALVAGLAVAAVTLARAFASPLGMTALDAVAPIAFLVFVLALSVRLLMTGQTGVASGVEA